MPEKLAVEGIEGCRSKHFALGLQSLLIMVLFRALLHVDIENVILNPRFQNSFGVLLKVIACRLN